jgi:putative glutamine amidotransferase
MIRTIALKKIGTLILISSIFLWTSCSQQEKAPITIAISKGSPKSSYENYYKWLEYHDSTITIIDMYSLPLDSALIIFESCDGLLITGGTDVYPGVYGKEHDTVRCWEPDHKRDSLELSLIKAARNAGTPMLGICRGHQIINIGLGGSLIVDIPSDFDTIIEHQCEDYQNCFHKVTVESNSLLNEISGIYAGEVNSNHHQGVDRLARELKAVSYASDGLIEAVEWAYPEGNPFLLGVQWHPERMDYENPLSGPIAIRFLEEARDYARQETKTE